MHARGRRRAEPRAAGPVHGVQPTQQRPRMIGRTVPLGLSLVAAAYFLHTIGSQIDWVDEGHLVYMSWRVSQGALPYREFHHIYGPSTFFLNGLLFRLFGPDLFVTRLSVLVLKA